MSVSGKCAQSTTQLRVDEYILDYLLFRAIQAHLLRHRISGASQDANVSLQLVDSFLTIFQQVHGEHQRDMEIEYRLRLLTFVVCFTTREISSNSTPGASILRRLDLKRHENARTFMLKDGSLAKPDLPDLSKFLIPCDMSSRKQEKGLLGVTSRDCKLCSVASTPPVSLLDTLPLFMALSARHNAMQDTSITDAWMRLAAGYMTHAFAEQYLVYENQQSETLWKAFAWGFNSNSTAEEGSDEWVINAMFFDEDDGVVAGWEEVRMDHMRALEPPDGSNLRDHLNDLLQSELPLDEFNHRLLSFLDGLLQSQPRPVLLQFESGQVEGLSLRDAQALQAKVGILREAALL